MLWKIGTSSFDNFFNNFYRAEMKSLVLTREVLTERQQLERLILLLQGHIKLGFILMDAIKQENNALKLAEKRQQFDALEREMFSLIKEIQESNKAD